MTWPRSSIGQSAGLSIRRLRVRIASGSLYVPPDFACANFPDNLLLRKLNAR